MYCCLGTTRECAVLNGYFPQQVIGEILRGVAVLESEMGEDRNYFVEGGYSLIADTEEDLCKAREIFDDRLHYCEWATKIGNTGFCSALYLLSNECSVMLYIPISLANKDILENMED